jgi:cytochrome c553
MSRARALAAAGLATLGLGRAAAASPAQDYMLYCMGCHGAQAQGVPGKIPPLAGALPLYMRTPAGRDYVLRVPGAANSALSDARLAAVLNWLAATYAPTGETPPATFSTEEVTRIRHTPLANVQATRREIVRALSASGPAPALDY